MRSRKARPLLILVMLALLAAGGAWIAGYPPNFWPVAFNDLWSKQPDGAQAKELASAPAPQPIGFPVEVAEAKAVQSWQEIRSVGTLQSDESVWIAAEVAGRIKEILFEEGQSVHTGDLLVRFDDELAQVELVDAQAQLDLAEANFKRVSTLAESGSATQRSRDEAQTELARARALVALISARIDKLAITAPFDGVVGIRKFSVGYVLAPQTKTLPGARVRLYERWRREYRRPEERK